MLFKIGSVVRLFTGDVVTVINSQIKLDNDRILLTLRGRDKSGEEQIFYTTSVKEVIEY